jgi:uncharacterized protein (TIGR00661 family)
MKFLFVVQGEGRGHMTQAISLAQILENRGFELCGVCVGKSNRRAIPDFFRQKINAPIILFESPNFVTDKQNKGIKLGKTVFHNLMKYNTFKKSLKQIHQVVSETQPDIILNFYDILGGIYNLIYKPQCQFWTIGHQYLINHPDFAYPKGRQLEKLLFQLNTKITSLGSQKQLALSFRPLAPSQIQNTHVLPPLLRKELRKLVPSKGDFYLTYMVNPGYGEEILLFAKANPHINIVAFWDKKGAPDLFKPLKNVLFYQVNDVQYLEKMAACKALICTAGFESVCEAMYLGKPVMMIPVRGQYEQQCNALDSVYSQAGISSDKYDFLKMESFLNSHKYQPTDPKKWMDSFEDCFIRILENSFPVTERKITSYNSLKEGLLTS